MKERIIGGGFVLFIAFLLFRGCFDSSEQLATARTPRMIRVYCPQCQGTGKVVDLYQNIYFCPQCQGTGQVWIPRPRGHVVSFGSKAEEVDYYRSEAEHLRNMSLMSIHNGDDGLAELEMKWAREEEEKADELMD